MAWSGHFSCVSRGWSCAPKRCLLCVLSVCVSVLTISGPSLSTAFTAALTPAVIWCYSQRVGFSRYNCPTDQSQFGGTLKTIDRVFQWRKNKILDVTSGSSNQLYLFSIFHYLRTNGCLCCCVQQNLTWSILDALKVLFQSIAVPFTVDGGCVRLFNTTQ